MKIEEEIFQKSKNFVTEQFSIETMVENYEEIYNF